MAGEKGFTLWFTGLSGAGKTTISRLLEGHLRERGSKLEILDGDVVRENLSKGLGFSKEDRDINIRRIAFVADLLSRNGVPVITAAISPYAGSGTKPARKPKAPSLRASSRRRADTAPGRAARAPKPRRSPGGTRNS